MHNLVGPLIHEGVSVAQNQLKMYVLCLVGYMQIQAYLLVTLLSASLPLSVLQPWTDGNHGHRMPHNSHASISDIDFPVQILYPDNLGLSVKTVSLHQALCQHNVFPIILLQTLPLKGSQERIAKSSEMSASVCPWSSELPQVRGRLRAVRTALENRALERKKKDGGRK